MTQQHPCACPPPSGPRTAPVQHPGLPADAASADLRAALSASLRAIPGGFCEMGSATPRYAIDRDSPRRRVRLDPFALGATTVTNRLFARFVKESGYRTTAEQEGWSFVFQLFLRDPGRHPHHAPGTPWWRRVTGADWAHPEGPESSIEDRLDHPVVHVSWLDAAAFAQFTGTLLPTEAQWEHAARGGLKRARFPWGNDMCPGGRHLHNTWQGRFPMENTAEDGHVGTAPAESYPPNGHGLFNMTGNVWEWVADWFGDLPPARIPPQANPSGPSSGTSRVMRGGSHLCHLSYCARYFVHSRSHNSPDSSTGHIGFRIARATDR